ncbi:MarR family transcriptional regulator [Flavobacteriales bacterium]|nr:MarR family transcriptional regulator [Flavobacteriales bacterium]
MRLEDEIQSKFRNEAQKARLNIRFTDSYLHGKMQSMMKSFGLTGQQYNILRILRGQKTNAATVGLIKERMLDRNSDVSRILDRLVAKKLIERREGSIDRRQKELRITADGLDLVAKMDQPEEDLDNLLHNLSSKEIEQLNHLLDKIRDN